MKKKVFISYALEDTSYKGEIEKWLRQAGVMALSKNRNEITAQNTAESVKELTEYILKSEMTLILVGNNTHNSQWVARKISIAKSNRVPCFWIRLSNRTGAPPVEVRSIAEIEYDKTKISLLLQLLNII